MSSNSSEIAAGSDKYAAESAEPTQNEPRRDDLDASPTKASTMPSSQSTPLSPSSRINQQAEGNPSSSSPSRSMSLRLSLLAQSPSTPADLAAAATSSPRSARAVNRKRMSIGYIPSPTRESPTKARLPAVAASSPLANGAATTSVPQRTETAAPEPHPTTLMDLSKDLLADIARRERRVWELKEELKREEAELKERRTRWQKSMAKDMAAAQSHTSSSSISSSTASDQQTSPTLAMAQLRAARRQSQQPPQQQRNGVEAPSSPPVSLSDIPQLPPSVTDALRGFSALVPAGLSGHYDALLQGLNVPPASGDGEPISPRPLEALREETGEDGAAVSASKTTSNAARVTPRVTSPASESSKSTAPLPASSSSSSGWASQWSKRLRDAAAKAEKVIGDAITVEGPSSPQPTPTSPRQRQARSPNLSAASTSSSPWGKRSPSGSSTTSTEKGSGARSGKEQGRRPSLSPRASSNASATTSASSSSSHWAASNEREKQALASRPEVSWLAQLVSGGGGGGSSSNTATTARSSVSSKATATQSTRRPPSAASSTPTQLSEEALLALAEGDGIVRDEEIQAAAAAVSKAESSPRRSGKLEQAPPDKETLNEKEKQVEDQQLKEAVVRDEGQDHDESRAASPPPLGTSDIAEDKTAGEAKAEDEVKAEDVAVVKQGHDEG